MVEINNPCPKCGEETSLEQKFCNKCGNKVKPEKSTQHCGSCGIEITYPQETCNKCGSKVNLSKFQYNEPKRVTTKRWYLFPILLGIIGGVISWALLRESDYKMATNCLLVGIGVSIFYVIIFAIAMAMSDSSGSFQADWGE
jgi:uncharacterized membrane protein YvbJ